MQLLVLPLVERLDFLVRLLVELSGVLADIQVADIGFLPVDIAVQLVDRLPVHFALGRVVDNFDIDCHMGMIDHKNAVIKINKDLKGLNRTETLCHEMVHGMLLHMGYDDLCNNEQFVQAMGNAICQGFDIKEVNRE